MSIHQELNIPNWQFSVYCETLIETIAYVLGAKSTLNVMEAWIRVFSCKLRKLLNNVILVSHVRKLEFAANYDQSLIEQLKNREAIDDASKISKFMSLSSSEKCLSNANAAVAVDVDFSEEVDGDNYIQQKQNFIQEE